MNAPRPTPDSVYRKTLDAQVTLELDTRPGSPKLDYDRLRAMQPQVVAKLDALCVTMPLDAERKRSAQEFAVVVGAVKEQFAALDRAHVAWVSAPSAAQLWSADATTAAAEVLDCARAIRRTVSDRLSDDSDRDAELRRRIGVGVEVGRAAPLAVADLALSQLAVLRDPEAVPQLESLGIEPAAFVALLEPVLKRLQVEMSQGPGRRRGEARVQRDFAQRRLEILLSRATAKVHAAFGAKPAAEFDALLPRPVVRRAADAVEPAPVDPLQPVQPVVPVPQ